MGRIWTEESKYRCWLQVETAASTVLAEDGVIPVAAAEAIAAKASFSVKRIQEIEAEVKHDVIAFNTAVAESLAAAVEGEPIQCGEWLAPLKISFGVRQIDAGVSAEQILSDADQAMYASKRAK